MTSKISIIMQLLVLVLSSSPALAAQSWAYDNEGNFKSCTESASSVESCAYKACMKNRSDVNYSCQTVTLDEDAGTTCALIVASYNNSSKIRTYTACDYNMDFAEDAALLSCRNENESNNDHNSCSIYARVEF